jgi:tetratricopeptide (TPR) repeat protein
MGYTRLFVLGVIVLTLTAATLRGQGNPEAARLSREGVEAAKAKDWNKAVDSFRRAAQVEPQDKKNSDNLAIALLQRATALVAQHNYDAAINDLNEAIKLKPDEVSSHRFRAYAYMSKGDWNNALQDYSVVIRALKDDPEAYERRAYVEMQLKDYDKALADYSEAIKLKPNEPKYYQLRALILQTKGDLKAALADTNKVLQFDPNNANAQQVKRFLEAKINGPPPPTPTPAGPIPNPNAPPPQTGQSVPSNQAQPSPTAAKP